MAKTREEARSVIELSEDERRKRESLDEKALDFLTEIETAYINSGGKKLTVTSGRRDPSQKVGANYKTSLHNEGLALDIEPDVEFYKWALNTPEGVSILAKHKYRIFDETHPEVKARTGATGDHFHLDNDSRYNSWIIDRDARLKEGKDVQMLAPYLDFKNKGVTAGGHYFKVEDVEYYVSNDKSLMVHTNTTEGVNTVTDENVTADVQGSRQGVERESRKLVPQNKHYGGLGIEPLTPDRLANKDFQGLTDEVAEALFEGFRTGANFEDLSNMTEGFQTVTDENVIAAVLKATGNDFKPTVLNESLQESTDEIFIEDFVSDLAPRLKEEENFYAKEYVRRLKEIDDKVKEQKQMEELKAQRELAEQEKLEILLGVYDNMFGQNENIIEEVDVAPLPRDLPTYTPTPVRFTNPFLEG